jgi:hypothetical protein
MNNTNQAKQTNWISIADMYPDSSELLVIGLPAIPELENAISDGVSGLQQ